MLCSVTHIICREQNNVITIIGASRNKPHINHIYERVTVLMYMCMYVHVCVYVAIRRPHAHHAHARVHTK